MYGMCLSDSKSFEATLRAGTKISSLKPLGWFFCYPKYSRMLGIFLALLTIKTGAGLATRMGFGVGP